VTPAVQNLDAELAVLGAPLLAPALLDVLSVEVGLRPEHFTRPEHAGLYRTMLDLHDHGTVPDELTLRDRHPEWITVIGHAIASASPAMARQHAMLVKDASTWALRLRATYEQQAAIEARDESAYQAAVTVNEPDRAPDAVHTPERLASDLEAFLDDPNRNVIPLPWDGLNRKISGGLFAGNTTVLSGFSSHGKSIVGLQAVEHIANLNGHAGFYTNEMPPLELHARLIAGVAEVEFARIMARTLTADERDAVRQAGRLVFFPIVDVRGWPTPDICRHLRRSKWDLAVLDLFNALPGRDDLQATDAAVYRLRDAAGISGCHLVVVAQLNRGRDDKAIKPAPTLRDLRETASMEHAPANVMFVHREQEDIDDPLTGQRTGRVRRLNTGVVYMAKARNGDPDAAVAVRLDPSRMRYEEMRNA
jgi:replicative DNA helicase